MTGLLNAGAELKGGDDFYGEEEKVSTKEERKKLEQGVLHSFRKCG